MDDELQSLEGFGTGTWVFIFLIAAFYIYTYWRIFEKAGQPGWASLIPIYDALIVLRIIGKPWWWILLYMIPGVNIVFAIWTINLLSLSFGKGVGFTLGLIFLGGIFYPILAFSNIEYQGPAGK